MWFISVSDHLWHLRCEFVCEWLFALYVSPTMSWQLVQGVPRLLPKGSWDRLQPPPRPLSGLKMMGGIDWRSLEISGIFLFYLLEARSLQEVEIYLTCADMPLDRFCSPRQIHVRPYLWIDFVCINTASEICQQGTGQQWKVRYTKQTTWPFLTFNLVAFWCHSFTISHNLFYTYGAVLDVLIHTHKICPSFNHRLSS